MDRKKILAPIIILILVPGFFLNPPVNSNLEFANFKPFLDSKHFLGCDRLGRDLLSLFYFGLIGTLITSIPARFLSILFGLILSLLHFLKFKPLNKGIEVLSLVFLSLPSLVLAYLILFTLGKSILVLFLAEVLTSWPSIFESLSSKIRELENSNFVMMSYSFGIPKFKVFIRHIFPNLVRICNYLFITGLPGTIMGLAILNFLGIDIGSDYFGPGLGEQISFSKDTFEKSPLSLILPIVGIFSIVFGLRIFSKKS
jgi:peptide/nickel transport system permease protein